MEKGKICMIDVVPWHLRKSLAILMEECTMNLMLSKKRARFSEAVKIWNMLLPTCRVRSMF